MGRCSAKKRGSPPAPLGSQPGKAAQLPGRRRRRAGGPAAGRGRPPSRVTCAAASRGKAASPGLELVGPPEGPPRLCKMAAGRQEVPGRSRARRGEERRTARLLARRGVPAAPSLCPGAPLAARASLPAGMAGQPVAPLPLPPPLCPAGVPQARLWCLRLLK